MPCNNQLLANKKMFLCPEVIDYDLSIIDYYMLIYEKHKLDSNFNPKIYLKFIDYFKALKIYQDTIKPYFPFEKLICKTKQ